MPPSIVNPDCYRTLLLATGILLRSAGGKPRRQHRIDRHLAGAEDDWLRQKEDDRQALQQVEPAETERTRQHERDQSGADQQCADSDRAYCKAAPLASNGARQVSSSVLTSFAT